MKEITDITDKALLRYFMTLTLLGYKDYDSVNKLIVLLYLEECINDSFSLFINEEDYRDIINSIYCLCGNCTIEFPLFKVYDNIVHKDNTMLIPRATENYVIRTSENEYLRRE